MSWAIFAVIFQVLGAISAIDAVYWVRTSQGAIAWAFSLLFCPYLALPLYWIFGRTRFRGYRELLKEFVEANAYKVETITDALSAYRIDMRDLGPAPLIERASGANFLGGNDVRLLVNGEQYFPSMIEAIGAARRYILLQTYILRDDGAGEMLKQALTERARAGVNVYLLYDEVGSALLGSSFIESCRENGIDIRPFDSTRRGLANFLQLNFRNHRKITVVDGEVAFVGGHNIGDEYLGSHPTLGKWRDTHVRIEGPAALQAQAAFFVDWYWAAESAPEVTWEPKEMTQGMRAAVIRTGPSDLIDRCSLLYQALILSAKKRLWISTPYYVPDEAIVSSLQLAALSGVDVRLILPHRADHYFVWLASFAYLPDIRRVGVRVYRYKAGFLHQKALIVDDEIAVVGTANLDFRSFRLNFEATAVVPDKRFTADVARMFEADLALSEEDPRSLFDEYPWQMRLGSKFARLFAPVL